MTSSLLPHPPIPGGPAATYGGTRADRTREHPTDAPTEDEVSAASQWLGHARFAHGARCAPGLVPSDPVDLHTILRVCTLESTSGDSQTHSTYSPRAHTLLRLHTRLAVRFRDSWASQTCQSHSWLDVELGHSHPGSTRHIHLHILALIYMHTPRHLPQSYCIHPPDGIHPPKMSYFCLPTETYGTTPAPKRPSGSPHC